MREEGEAVKWGGPKLEGATQKMENWGQIWGQNRAGGMIWGAIMTIIVR
mgnify:CR=1 FL=1